MFLLVAHFGSLSFTQVFSAIAQHPEWQGAQFLTAIALLLVLGAAGKSAQIPLYIWLPDAMEGPTPVSALIHAATMVTAGVYMVARCHVLFDSSPAALTVVACIGAATAIFAASIGMVQHDIKRVLAYSTISQLGYMFLACGVGAYAAGIFHLLTHSFFKALLFLAAGSVIHALSGEQDMRRMGGLRTRTPITFWTMSAGVFAIAGIPPFAGFFSKDEILYQTFAVEQSAAHRSVAHRPRHCRNDFVLHVPPLVQDLFRRAAHRAERNRRTARSERHSRIPVDHAAAAGAFSRFFPSPADGSAFPPRWAATTESNASSVPSSQTARPAKPSHRQPAMASNSHSQPSPFWLRSAASTSPTSSTTRNRAPPPRLRSATGARTTWSRTSTGWMSSTTHL